MLKNLVVAVVIVAMPSAALAQESCRYFAGDGLSVEFTSDAAGQGQIDLRGRDGSVRQCALSPTEDAAMLLYKCGEFVGDLILVPSKAGEKFPDIIVMPPNILYWRCAVAT